MIYKFYTCGLEKLILELLSYPTVFWLNYHSPTDSGKKRKETRKKERNKEEGIKEREERKTLLGKKQIQVKKKFFLRHNDP